MYFARNRHHFEQRGKYNSIGIVTFINDLNFKLYVSKLRSSHKTHIIYAQCDVLLSKIDCSIRSNEGFRPYIGCNDVICKLSAE